jgi:outer membrane protein TolC
LVHRFFYIIIPLIVLAAQAFAQSAAKPLSLEDCVRLAQDAQSSISIAGQESEIARYGFDRARAAFFPQVQLNNAYTYNSPQLHNPEEFSFVALNGIREYNTQLTAVEELDIFGRLRAQLARARADRDAATASFKLSRRDLKRVVSASFYRVLLARHLVQSAKDAVAEAQVFATRTQLLFEKGESARADVFKASSQVAFLEQSLNSIQLEAEIANHDLASFWTDAVADELILEDPLSQPVPTLELLLGVAGGSQPPTQYLQRPEFSLLEAQHQGFLADSRQARASLLPQASIVFQYGIDSQRWSLGDRGYAAFVNLNIPLFDWFRTRDQVRQFQLKAQQIQVTREVATRTYSKEYQDALSRLKSLVRQVSVAENQVKLSEESLQLSRIRYEGGEGSALEVVDAQNQLTQARTNYYTALAGCWNAKIDLEVATGQ